jgi:hypothetical protein
VTEKFLDVIMRAERSVLISTGFQYLHELGWEWTILARIEKRYQLSKCGGWDEITDEERERVTLLRKTQQNGASPDDPFLGRSARNVAISIMTDGCASIDLGK